MLVYKQSIFDISIEQKNDILKYNIKSDSGKRVEKANGDVLISTDDNNISVEEIKLNISENKLKSLYKFISNINKNIEFFSHLYLHNEKVIINDIEDFRNYGFLKLVFTRNDNFIIEEIPIINNNFDDLEQKIIKVIDKSKNFLEFTALNKNHRVCENIPVVFSANAAGFLVHEILGHTLEEDFYKYYSDKYKNLKFTKNLNVIDNPQVAAELTGVSKYDDIGVDMSSVTLVKDGIISDILSLDSEKDSENTTTSKISGTGRRENYKYNVLPRMRCTYIEPFGDMNEEEIINKYKKCIFIYKTHSGGIDPANGDFELNGVGFVINDNETQNFIGNLKISGNILKHFNAIEYIGNDLKFFGGYCFKLGQTVRVATGSPTVSINDLVVEGDFYV